MKILHKFFWLAMIAGFVLTACATQATGTSNPADAPTLPPTTVPITKPTEPAEPTKPAGPTETPEPTEMPVPTETPEPVVIEGMFDVGGLELYLRCEGEGSPTIVYLHGWMRDYGVSGAWNGLSMQSQMSDRYRFCVYDRRNVGESDKVEGYFTGVTAIEDLHALLAAAGVEPPYVLLGASLGGLISHLYAATYPGEVVGMVLLDSPVPAELDLDGLLPEDERLNHEDDKGSTEDLDRAALFEEAYAVEQPAIPVVYMLALPPDEHMFGVPEFDAVILDTIREQVAGYSPGIIVEVESPHFMERSVPQEIMAELEEVIALANGESAQ